MITAGSKLNSLSQIASALKSGYAVEAELIFTDVCEDFREHHIQCDVIRVMTSLHESAYYWLVSMDHTEWGPLDHLDMYHSRWEFTVIES